MCYTVYQVAEMLSVNPETVRRWIRRNKLKASMTSKIDGYHIDESSLVEFKKQYNKRKVTYNVELSDWVTLGIRLELIRAKMAEIDKLVTEVNELLALGDL